MKHFLLSLALLSAITLATFAQNLVLLDSLAGQLQPLAPNATVVKHGHTNVEIVKYLAVKNNSADSLHVKVKKEYVNVLHGTINMFCWGLCFGPDVMVSPWSKTIKAGEINTLDFSGHYQPGTVTGASIIRYTFFVDENPNDSVSVLIEYSAYPLGTNQPGTKDLLSEAYPNPSSVQASFNYALPEGSAGEIVVRNLLGTTVANIMLDGTSGKTAIDVTNLREGLYFYTLILNGKVVLTRKMVVRH